MFLSSVVLLASCGSKAHDEAKEEEIEVSKNECKHHCDTDAKSVTHGFKETPQVDDDIKVLMDVLKSLRSF